MNKKIIYFLIAVLLISTAAVFAGKEIKWQIFINGSASQITPLTYKNKIYLPLDQTAEAFNFKVSADPDKSSIQLLPNQPPADEQKIDTPKEKFGTINGNVKFNINEESSMNFEGKEAVLTACADKPYTGKELKNHFFSDQSSYFYHHIPVYTTTIDKDGNFLFKNIKPGEYDVLIFNKREAPFGYQRVAWKVYVNVTAEGETKVKLDNYNRALDDFVYLQK